MDRVCSAFAVRSLSSASRPCRDSFMAHTFLHCLRGLRYDQQLFCLHPRGLPQDLSEMLIFYQDHLQTWKLVLATSFVVGTKGRASLQST